MFSLQANLHPSGCSHFIFGMSISRTQVLMSFGLLRSRGHSRTTPFLVSCSLGQREGQ